MGLTAPDDAAVYKLDEDRAVVLTVDFFAPLVDSPYDYGAIAAANAISDIYAMGGEVVLALNVAAFPEDFPKETIAEVLQGGSDKVREAGGVIAGGHTTIDTEPKYGLCVMGLVHPAHIFTKGGARPGDLLFLTKPVGTGIITTAAMRDLDTTGSHLSSAVESMTALNRHASHLARQLGVISLTDVSGFGLLGHAYEMAAAGGVSISISAGAVPLLPGALEYARAGVSTGGEGRNREYLAEKVRFTGIDAALERALFDPQTSGGLLFALPPERQAEAERLFAESALGLWRIGAVSAGADVEVV